MSPAQGLRHAGALNDVNQARWKGLTVGEGIYAAAFAAKSALEASEFVEAYAFWMFGQIALIAGIAAFALAFLMAIMVAFGFWHAGKTEDTQELEVHKAQAPKVLVGV